MCTFRFMIILFLLPRSVSGQDSSAFVKLNSGSKIYGKVSLSESGRELIVNDTSRFDIKNVMAYQNKDGYFAKVTKRGLFSTDVFIRREKEGKIWLYNDDQTFWYGDSKMRWASTAYVTTHYSMGETPPRRLKVSNLKESLAGHSKSMAILKTHDTLNYFILALLLGGLAIVASSFKGVDKDHPPSENGLILGGVVANLAWIPHFAQGDSTMKAIEAYNKERGTI